MSPRQIKAFDAVNGYMLFTEGGNIKHTLNKHFGIRYFK